MTVANQMQPLVSFSCQSRTK